jgi:glycosyltransferase involved in cell wall biosynthesis
MKDVKERILSIVIPTFNRSIHLDKQLTWASDNIGSKWNQIELIVIDNASNDSTPKVCKKWKEKLNENIQIYRNDENIGVMKNILRSISYAKADFVWVVGDDDPIRANAIDLVLKEIYLHPSSNLIHINHRCVDSVGNVIVQQYYNRGQDFYVENGVSIEVNNLLRNTHTGGIMFITACVLNRKKALEFIKNNPPKEKRLLAYQLFLNVSLALKGPFSFISNCCVDCTWGECSWKDQMEIHYYEEIPNTLIRLRKNGLSKEIVQGCFNFQYSGLPPLKEIFRRRSRPWSVYLKSVKKLFGYKLIKKFYEMKLTLS